LYSAVLCCTLLHSSVIYPFSQLFQLFSERKNYCKKDAKSTKTWSTPPDKKGPKKTNVGCSTHCTFHIAPIYFLTGGCPRHHRRPARPRAGHPQTPPHRPCSVHGTNPVDGVKRAEATEAEAEVGEEAGLVSMHRLPCKRCEMRAGRGR
jgi:hypothetical protein